MGLRALVVCTASSFGLVTNAGAVDCDHECPYQGSARFVVRHGVVRLAGCSDWRDTLRRDWVNGVAFDHAAVVIVGRVEAVEDAGAVAPSAQPIDDVTIQETIAGTSSRLSRIALVVTDTIKGEVTGRIQFESLRSFEPGKSYVIYGPQAGGRLVVPQCSRLKAADDARHTASAEGYELVLAPGPYTMWVGQDGLSGDRSSGHSEIEEV